MTQNEMVDNQIKSRGISDPDVLNALIKVPREKFVLNSFLSEAFEDYPLPIGHSQTISQPYIVAYMTDALKLNKSHKVLEIGTGSGYQTAILSEICLEVFTVERIPELSQKAQKVLAELGYQNINFHIGDGYNGWEENKPYDRIIVTCAGKTVPAPLINQLKNDGLLCMPVAIKEGIQDLVLIQKESDVKINKESLTYVSFVPMIHEE